MTLLELEGVTAAYGPVQVLEDVSLTVPDGGAVGILGANGAGKTTTLRAISGTVRAGGRIVFDGRDVRGLRPDQVAALRQDLAAVRSHPLIGDRAQVAGFIYDVDTGLLEPVG